MSGLHFFVFIVKEKPSELPLPLQLKDQQRFNCVLAAEVAAQVIKVHELKLPR